jgi:hypothetical protein
MKKILYILLALILLAGLGYFFFVRNNSEVTEIGNTVIQPGDELNWSAHFPDEVPEYIDGEIRELSIVDPEMSRFEDEVTAIVDETSYEEFVKYSQELQDDGWMISYESPEGQFPYNLQLSLEDRRISTSLGDDGVLRLSSYIVVEE